MAHLHEDEVGVRLDDVADDVREAHADGAVVRHALDQDELVVRLLGEDLHLLEVREEVLRRPVLPPDEALPPPRHDLLRLVDHLVPFVLGHVLRGLVRMGDELGPARVGVLREGSPLVGLVEELGHLPEVLHGVLRPKA